jgi:hypothetical protein
MTRHGTKLVAYDAASYDYYGSGVSIHKDTLCIGAYRADPGGIADAGSVYVYVRDGMGVWSFQQKLFASDGLTLDWFGSYGIAVYDDMVLVGAHHDHIDVADAGSVYVFTRTDSTWYEQTKLSAAVRVANDYFGYAVSLYGNVALIGSYLANVVGTDSGSAFVFSFTEGTWSAGVQLMCSDSSAGDEFGLGVALSVDTGVVGSRKQDPDRGIDAGSAYVFVTNGTWWSEQAKLTAPDGLGGDYFGQSVDIYADTVVVGAYLDHAIWAESSAIDVGSAYVFVRDSSSVWSMQAKLTASDGAASDQFGVRLAVFGDSVVVGARYDDDIASATGSAYVFERIGSTWREYSKVAAVTGEAVANSEFGRWLDVYDNDVIIAAWRNDGPIDSGRAYAGL